jgi:glycosyltransferase involved in cell wall biosynthesis
VNNDKQSTNRTKKLLIISPWESIWSLEGKAGVSDDFHFIDKFTRRDYELHFLIPKSEANDQFDIDGLTTYKYPNFFRSIDRLPTPLRRFLIPLLFNLIVTPRAFRLARKLDPDFVLGHTHFSTLVTYALKKFCSLATGVKLFGVMDLVHTEWPRWKYFFKNFEQIVALKCPQDLWIVLDDGTKGDEVLLAHGIEPAKIHFLPNGINLEWANLSFNREATRKEFGIPTHARAVLFLARLVRSKRPESVVQAIPHTLKSVQKETCFLFAGDGPSKASCEKLARQLGVSENSRFIGTIPHEKVPEIFHACDLFVTTSNLTNMAIPTCESFLCGVPVVAFDVGATGKVVIDGETGRTVPDGDIEALARAIADLIADDNNRAAMGRNAKQFALDHFMSWDERTDLELAIINAEVDKGSSGDGR